MISESVEKEVIKLYFEEMYNYSKLISYFKNKYTYAELKKVIMNHIKKYEDK